MAVGRDTHTIISQQNKYKEAAEEISKCGGDYTFVFRHCLSRDIMCRNVSGELESLKYINIVDINIKMVFSDTFHVKRRFVNTSL